LRRAAKLTLVGSIAIRNDPQAEQLAERANACDAAPLRASDFVESPLA